MFEFASASVVGRDHRLAGRNNQDAFAVRQLGDGGFVAIVADGCSSAPFSETGARFGVESLSEFLGIWKLVDHSRSLGIVLRDWVFDSLLGRSNPAGTTRLGNLLRLPTKDFALFTLLGLICDGETISLFYAGDGIYAINDQITRIGPYPGNAPPYIVYPDSEFTVLTYPADEVSSFMIGTDGVLDLINHAQSRVPGSDESVGSLNQFWADDGYFSNPDALRRRLTLINRDVHRLNRKTDPVRLDFWPGLLHDDMTMIVGRVKHAKST